MNQELRQMVSEALAFGDVMDDANLGVSRLGHADKTARFIRLDMVKFLLYLSGSDDVISDDEAKFFQDYLGYNFEAAQIASLIERFALDKDSFLTTVPFSFGVMIDADTLILSQVGKNPGAAMALLRVYHALGDAFISCDGNVAEAERRDFDSYLSMLQSAIEAATEKAQAQYDEAHKETADEAEEDPLGPDAMEGEGDGSDEADDSDADDTKAASAESEDGDVSEPMQGEDESATDTEDADVCTGSEAQENGEKQAE